MDFSKEELSLILIAINGYIQEWQGTIDDIEPDLECIQGKIEKALYGTKED